MAILEFSAASYRKPILPVTDFAKRFKPQLCTEGSSSIPEKMRLESRRNIREFLTIMSKMHNGFQEPIIDVACGYRSNFSEATSFSPNGEVAYIAFDHFLPEKVEPYPPDFTASVYSIPLPNAVIGTVLSTELLEHVEYPHAAVAEMVRVLRPDGTIIVTVPGKDVPKHEKPPFQYDYRRFTCEELQKILEQNGIGDIEITQRWFQDEDGSIKEINLLAVGKKETTEGRFRRTQPTQVN